MEVDDVIDRLGGLDAAARLTGVGTEAVRKWRQARAVPSRHWPAVIAATGAMDAAVLFGDYVPYLLYLAFAEGTLTGMVLTLAVVYRPQWVATFDDARYLK